MPKLHYQPRLRPFLARAQDVNEARPSETSAKQPVPGHPVEQKSCELIRSLNRRDFTADSAIGQFMLHDGRSNPEKDNILRLLKWPSSSENHSLVSRSDYDCETWPAWERYMRANPTVWLQIVDTHVYIPHPAEEKRVNHSTAGDCCADVLMVIQVTGLPNDAQREIVLAQQWTQWQTGGKWKLLRGTAMNGMQIG